MRGDRLHRWNLGGLGRAGRSILRRGGRRQVKLLGACDFATCPIVLERLQCPHADALVDPSVMKYDLPFLSCILAIKILARFFVGVDEYIGCTAIAG